MKTAALMGFLIGLLFALKTPEGIVHALLFIGVGVSIGFMLATVVVYHKINYMEKIINDTATKRNYKLCVDYILQEGLKTIGN